MRGKVHVCMFFLGFGAGLWLPFGAQAANSQASRPNIIYILADDLGYGELGCYGQRKIRTPHLDQMAAEGMRFTQHYCGAAVCGPSRYTLLTGRHIGRSRSYGQGQRLTDEPTLHKLCKRAGYATAAIGKWGVGDDPNDQGVDEWYGFISQGYAHFYYPERIWENRKQLEIPENYEQEGLRVEGKYTDKVKGGVYIHDSFTEKALSFISQNQENPFFLYLPYTIPHLELAVPEDSMEPYRNAFDERPFIAAKHSPEAIKNKPVGGTTFYDGLGYCDHDTARAAYAGMISRMDRDVGRIMQRLKDLHLDKNTLVIFASDNGPSWWSTGGCDREFFESAGPLRGGKASFYEGGIRVPMIARWPAKIAAGTISQHVSYFPDILPTFAELLNLELTTQTDGISMLPTLLQKGEQAEHDFLFWEKAVRMGKWKYISGGRDFRGNRKRGLLFNLEMDPSESRDVSSENPELVQQMKTIMNENKIRKQN